MAWGKKIGIGIDGMEICLSALLFVGAVCGIHQMQAAEGIGLYWMEKTGGTLWQMNALVDCAAAGALFLLAFLPARLFKHSSWGAVSRFLTGFLALMPSLSMSHLLHLFDEGTDGFDPELLLFALGTVLPLVAFLFLGVECFERAFRGWYGAAGILALLSGVLMYWESQVFGFLLVYLFLLVGADLWERLLKPGRKTGLLGGILFGGLWVRAVYCILMLWSVY